MEYLNPGQLSPISLPPCYVGVPYTNIDGSPIILLLPAGSVYPIKKVEIEGDANGLQVSIVDNGQQILLSGTPLKSGSIPLVIVSTDNIGEKAEGVY